MTFEELILKAKEAGREWRRAPRGGAGSIVRCADGRCILGALIHKVGIGPGDPRSFFGEDDFGEPIKIGLDVPEPEHAARLLNIPLELAERIIGANDGLDDAREDAKLLDQLLGITASA